MDKQRNRNSDNLILESIKIQFMDEGAEKGADKLHADLQKNLHLKIIPSEKISEGMARLGLETGEILITIILAPFVHDAVISILSRLEDFFKKWRDNYPRGQFIFKRNKNDSGRRFRFIEETDMDELYDHIEKYIERKRPKSLSEWLEANNKEREKIRRLFEKEVTFLDVDVVGSGKLREKETDLLVSAYSFEQYFKYITEMVEKNNGKVLDSIGGEVMAWFSVPDKAVNCASEIFSNRDVFNEKRNKMNAPFQFRIGINTGCAFIDETEGKVFSRGVLELAGYLQKEAEPGTFLISQDTYNKLGNKYDSSRYKHLKHHNAQSYIRNFGLLVNKNNSKKPNGKGSSLSSRRNLVKKILVLSANPKKATKLRLNEEVREIQEGLQLAKYRDHFEIYSKGAVRVGDLQKIFLYYEPHIVHFSGHGNLDGLLVEDEFGLPVRISSDALSGLFKLFSNQVECVILSACYSEPQAEAINAHIPYVVGMRREISDKAAIVFAVGFYDAIGAGWSVEDAFNLGCNAVQLNFPDLPEHLIPILKKGNVNDFMKEKK
jgi:class 3 adenylate cyclase